MLYSLKVETELLVDALAVSRWGFCLLFALSVVGSNMESSTLLRLMVQQAASNMSAATSTPDALMVNQKGQINTVDL